MKGNEHGQKMYQHRWYRAKYRLGYGAEGVALGKTHIGEIKEGMLHSSEAPKLSPKEETYRKDDAENRAEKKLSYKKRPNPY